MSPTDSVSNLSSVANAKHDAFQRFCSTLRNPVFTGNNYILASVNVLCYNDGVVSSYQGEILLITHGCGYDVWRTHI